MKKPSDKQLKASILVVDDNRELVESIEAQFTYCGFEVIKAFDPIRAFELSALFKPDIIIADIRMPKLDGISLIKKFKKVQPHVKVILMTGYYPEYERNISEAISAGVADKVIQKRFRATELEKLVYELLKSPKEEQLFSNAAKAKVLFVDDEVEVIDFLRDFFREKGFAVSVAKGAEDALVAYEAFEPDIVVTDIKMPNFDGIWLINEIKKQDNAAQIIAMTGQDSHELLQRLRRETGIGDCFAKPFGLGELQELHAMIDKCVNTRKTKTKK